MRRDRAQLGLAVHQARALDLVEHRQGGVGEDAEIHDQALAQAVLRHVGNARLHRLGGRGEDAALAGQHDVPAGGPVDAEEHAGDLGATAADQPADAEDLAGLEVERHVLERTVAPELLHLEHDRASRRRERRIQVRQWTPDHQPHRAVVRHVGHRRDLDDAAVAQHRHAVRHAVDLLHAVAHEHHRHAAGAQLGHNLEQPVDLARGQRGGGLVHDQDTGLHRQRARHFHQLLLGAAQPAERRARCARQAHGLEQALGLGMHAAMVERAERALELPPHEQVLGHREIGEQPRVLVHHGDAHALGIER